MADPEAESTQEIAGHLEDALLPLAMAASIADEAGRPVHARAIIGTLIQIEDLRVRNEEYDPDLADAEFPRVFRRWGTDPYAIRIAYAKDASRAIYKSLEASTERVFQTPYYVVYRRVEGQKHRVQAPDPIRIDLMPEVDAYIWDDPDEIKVAARTHEDA